MGRADAATAAVGPFGGTPLLPADCGESKVRVTPKFSATKDGLLLESVNNETQGGKTRLDETIEYTEIEGLRLPGKVHVDVVQPAGRFVIDVASGIIR